MKIQKVKKCEIFWNLIVLYYIVKCFLSSVKINMIDQTILKPQVTVCECGFEVRFSDEWLYSQQYNNVKY